MTRGEGGLRKKIAMCDMRGEGLIKYYLVSDYTIFTSWSLTILLPIFNDITNNVDFPLKTFNRGFHVKRFVYILKQLKLM